MKSTPDSVRKEIGFLLNTSLFPKWDFYFARHQHRFFLLSLVLLLILGLLSFDLRISTGGDDTAYLLAAARFSKGLDFPTFHGIFYSLMLGWIMSLTGFKLILFKSLSLVFLLGHQTLLYYAFRRRVSPFLLVSVLFITASSAGILYYGSQTYTEAFYMFLQAGFLMLMFSRIIDHPPDLAYLKKNWKDYLLLGLILVLMAKTRNIGQVALLAVLLYFLIRRSYLPGLATLASYLVWTLPYILYKRIIWQTDGIDTSAQLKVLLQKNPYNPSLGYENLGGMIVRFLENSRVFLSNILLKQMGFRAADSDGSGYFMTFLILAVLITGLVVSYRNRERIIQFLFLYLAVALTVTFLSLNQLWSQGRLILIYFPLLILAFAWIIAKGGQGRGIGLLRAFSAGGLLVILFLNGVSTATQVKENLPILKQQLAGNRYFGYTPDVANFLRMSEWTAKNIPDSIKIASRKPGMSFVYGDGRIYHPIYKLPFVSTDSILNSTSNTCETLAIINDMSFKGIKKTDVMQLKRYLKAIITLENDVYTLYCAEEKQGAFLLDSLVHSISLENTYQSVEEFRDSVLAVNPANASLLPDDMLNELYKNHVGYLIRASLRVRTEETGETLNTINRYLIAIEAKYPGTISVVHQIGEERKEPAKLFKIDYTRCQELGWKPGI
jgi:hypothetical protein